MDEADIAIEITRRTLTVPVVEKLIRGILDLLKKRRPSEKDLEELRDKLAMLVDLTHNTGIALRKYIQLLKCSTEASIHATELQNLLNFMPKELILQEFNKLKEVRMETNLWRNGIQEVYSFRTDYDQTREHYEDATKHMSAARSQFEAGNIASCNSEMEYLNQELDKLVVFVKRKVDEQLAPLLEAYNVLKLAQ